MDQNTERKAAVNVLESFLPDPKWENFSKAATGDQGGDKAGDQLGFGFPKYVGHAFIVYFMTFIFRFVSHEMLWRRDYVKDDTLFLKIRADPKKGVCV